MVARMGKVAARLIWCFVFSPLHLLRVARAFALAKGQDEMAARTSKPKLPGVNLRRRGRQI